MYFVTIEHGNALFMRHGVVDYGPKIPGTREKKKTLYIFVL